ncbi:MAG: vanadium-dependent haloperoxidase [Gammaproteobacteria bacterium]
MNKKNTTANRSRRHFLKSSAGLSAGALGGLTIFGAPLAQAQSLATDAHSDSRQVQRAKAAADLKTDAARAQFHYAIDLPQQRRNGDERRYKQQNFYASFTKALPSDQFGEVTPAAFRQLRRAMRTEKQADFARIDLAAQAQRKLVNPQGGLAFQAAGLDGHATRIAPAPTFRSAHSAAEMGEVYWQAITRDVPYLDYDIDFDVAAATNDLNDSFSATVGPKQDGSVTPQTLFRGETPGDLNGPFISQFLLKNVPFGPSTIEQRYAVPTAHSDYMLNPTEWLAVQRGADPGPVLTFEQDARYIYNNRALGEYVHKDVLFQAYFNAGLILLNEGEAALDPRHPYANIANQEGFTSFGGPWLLQLLTFAANLGLSGAWHQKWGVHRRLRPEAFGGRIHFAQTGQRNYEIHPDILNSDAMNRTSAQHGTFFLPMAYAEGSPVHPAYPAGHATVAGACATVLKAFFNEDYILRDTVQADATGHNLIPYNRSALRLGDEVNKLANNIALGRDAAGVHYRSDGTEGLQVGEQQAIALLRDCVHTCNEPFDGFTLTKFDGSTITISNQL